MTAATGVGNATVAADALAGEHDGSGSAAAPQADGEGCIVDTGSHRVAPGNRLEQVAVPPVPGV
jgi:hypothetical protein